MAPGGSLFRPITFDSQRVRLSRQARDGEKRQLIFGLNEALYNICVGRYFFTLTPTAVFGGVLVLKCASTVPLARSN